LSNSQRERHILYFSQINFIDANLCALLDAVFYKLKSDCGHRVLVDFHDIEKRFDVLLRNGFIQSKEFGIWIDDRNSTVRFTRFETDEDEKFLHYLDEKLFGHRAFKDKPGIKNELLDHFLEVFANIQLHAKTQKPVFACGQYFPKNGKLKFTLVDIGVGFLEPISFHTKGKIDRADKAIQWALEGNSTKPDAPGGLGLSKLKSYFSQEDHSMLLITDGKCWGNRIGLLDLGEDGHFPGTVINLEFCFN